MIEGALSTINKTKNYFVDLVIATFNESLSHFSDLEKNFVGQRVVPSPANAKSEKDERAAEAFDNLDIIIKSSFASDTKETYEVKNAICLSPVARSKIEERL